MTCMKDVATAIPTLLQQSLLAACLAEGRSVFNEARPDDETRLFINNLLALGVALVVDEPARRIDVAGAAGYWPNSDADLNCAGPFPLTGLLIAACCVGRGQYT